MSTRAVVQIRKANKTLRTLYVHGDGHPESLGYSLAKVFQELAAATLTHSLTDVPAMLSPILSGLRVESANMRIGTVQPCANSNANDWDIEFVYKAFIGPKSGVWKIHCKKGPLRIADKEGPFRNENNKVYQGTPNQWMAKRDDFLAAGY